MLKEQKNHSGLRCPHVASVLRVEADPGTLPGLLIQRSPYPACALHCPAPGAPLTSPSLAGHPGGNLTGRVRSTDLPWPGTPVRNWASAPQTGFTLTTQEAGPALPVGWLGGGGPAICQGPRSAGEPEHTAWRGRTDPAGVHMAFLGDWHRPGHWLVPFQPEIPPARSSAVSAACS